MNVLELFGGCGGLGWGFEVEKFNIVAYNELKENISQTYKYNFDKDTEIIVGDVTQDGIKKKIYTAFNKKKCNIIIGGPPCVAYSMSGHRNSRDPRGKLFNDYLAIVKKLNPEIFVMENVKGILTMYHDKDELTDEEKKLADDYYKLEEEKIKLELKKKTEKNDDKLKVIKKNLSKLKRKIKKFDTKVFREKVVDKIVRRFNNLGYKVEYRLLNSANYGVPQKRERVIFIGIKNELNREIHFPEITHKKENWITVRQAIDDLKDMEENVDFSQIYTKHRKGFIEKVKKTEIGKSVYPKYSESFYRCYPDKPSNTVKENHGGVFIHYEKNRVMTPRELARLQSFPDDFKFKGSKSCILVQLGNAVPCKLSLAIAKGVKKMIQ